MDVSKLLFASAMLLAAGQVNAEITPRVKPAPAKSPLTMGTPMYLYNSGAKGFFRGANDWGTRASFADNGYRVKIAKHIDPASGQAVDDGTVTLVDSVETKKQWLNTFLVHPTFRVIRQS